MVAAQALIMLQGSKNQDPKPQQKWTFNIPVSKSTPFVTGPPQVTMPAQPPVTDPIKHKRVYRAPSSPIKRNKGRFAKTESLFVPKPPKKAYTGTITQYKP